jgi:hypothetical protein
MNRCAFGSLWSSELNDVEVLFFDGRQRRANRLAKDVQATRAIVPITSRPIEVMAMMLTDDS